MSDEAQNPIARVADLWEQHPLLRAAFAFATRGSYSLLSETLSIRGKEIAKERFEALLTELETGEVQLSEEVLASEDFLHAVVVTVGAAARTRRRGKIRLLARLLREGMVGDRISGIDDFESLLGMLDQASTIDLALLTLLERHLNSLLVDAPHEDKLAARVAFRADAAKLGVSEDGLPAALAHVERTGLFKTMGMAVFDDGFMGAAYADDLGYGELSPAYFRLKEIVGDFEEATKD